MNYKLDKPISHKKHMKKLKYDDRESYDKHIRRLLSEYDDDDDTNNKTYVYKGEDCNIYIE